MASRARSRRRFKSSTSRLTMESYAIKGCVLRALLLPEVDLLDHARQGVEDQFARRHHDRLDRRGQGFQEALELFAHVPRGLKFIGARAREARSPGSGEEGWGC